MNLAIALLIGSAFLSGCVAHLPGEFRRYRYHGFNVIIADDDVVNEHCHKWAERLNGTWDNGHKVTSDGSIRACYDWPKDGRPGNILLGMTHQDCLVHELCHVEKLGPDGGSEAYCAKEYPCAGD